MLKINLGAGNDIRENFINHDIADLKGIDVVHDLNSYPWPWEDNSVDEILALDVIEHLDNFLLSMEEVYRILKIEGIINLKVPYWNSAYLFMDPTHRRGFHEATFYFFDPAKDHCKMRPYYTDARFSIVYEAFILIPFSPYLKLPFVKKIIVKNKYIKRFVGFFGNLFSNVILDLDITLIKIPLTKKAKVTNVS